jgi:hypothetical protein
LAAALSTKDKIGPFLASYPSAVAEVASALRSKVLKTMPDATETLDQSARVIGYAVGVGYAGLVCTIIPGKKGVKLGLVNGANLNDPQHLMEGAGKRHRYVAFNTRADLERPGVTELIAAAKATAASRVAQRS